MTFRTSGNFSEALESVERAIDDIKGPRTERAVTEVLIQVEGAALPMIPIATSALANSSNRQVRKAPNGWGGTLYYGADYAAYVHEAPGTLMGTDTQRSPARLGFVWGPNGEPKFLEKAIEETVNSGSALSTVMRAYD